MKRLDSRGLGRLAVAVRADRERKTVLEEELSAVTQRLAEREPKLAAALGEPPIGPAPATDGSARRR